MKNQHTQIDSRPGRKRSCTLHAPARLGQGVEQIEPRIMLAGEALTNVPALIAPVAEQARSIGDGGYVNFDSAVLYNSSNSFSYDGFGYLNSVTTDSSASDVVMGHTASYSSPHAVVKFESQFSGQGVKLLELSVARSMPDGGFAVMTLGLPTPVTSGPVSPSARDAIATGVTAPAVRSTLGSDAPLEAARGRSQAFELSASLQDVLRSAPIVNAHAVDAAMAQFGKMQPALTRVMAAPRKDPTATEVVEVDSPATIDRLLLAARKVEAQLASPQTGGAEAASLMSVPTRSTNAAQTSHRDAEQEAELPAEALLAAQTSPETDRDSQRKSVLAPLFELDSTVLTDAPGLWACAVVVSLAGLYWQKTSLAGQRWPARENDGPRLRRLAVRTAQ